MMRPNPFAEKKLVPERVPNDGEPSVFASPDRRPVPAQAQTLETKLHDRLRGLFAVTDGEASTVGGHVAALSVAEELQRQLGAALDTKLENLANSRVPEDRRRALMEQLVTHSVELAQMEAHRRLFEANQQNPRLRLRAHAAVARMVEFAPDEKELFFTLSGKERLYLVRDGEVSRLGEQGGAAIVAPGTLGEDIPLTVVHRETLEPGDRLFLLGDGAVRALRGVDVKEAAQEAVDPRVLEQALQNFAKSKVEDPRNHDAKAGDLSVVSWEAFPARKTKPKSPEVRHEFSDRRALLRSRLAAAEQDIARARALGAGSASGRQLVGAQDLVNRREAEKASLEAELLALDIPPRFGSGDRVTLATGKSYVVKEYADGKYFLRDARSSADETLMRSRWEVETAVDPAQLPVKSGDRIRVGGFTAHVKDDWHVAGDAHPPDRFFFETNPGEPRMAVPAGPTRQALREMIANGRALENQAFALKRLVQKTERGI